MASVSASQGIPQAARAKTRQPGELVHRVGITLAVLVLSGLIVTLAVHGFSYYRLGIEERPLSPMHPELRSSGSLGLRLAILALIMFAILFLYPLRKRWRWLASKGKTRRWLNFHVLFGITTPLVVTYHTSFKWHGVAGLAYWTMMAVAASGFIGRYVYAKIPRSLNNVGYSIAEIEAQMASLAERLKEQAVFRAEDLAPLVEVPSPKAIAKMNVVAMLWTMMMMDLKRPFQVSRLRRRVLSGSQLITTLGGLRASHNPDVELIISHARRQSRMRAAAAFLDRTVRIFHLWHVVHRPFSISFVILLAIHITVVLGVGL